MPNRLRRYVLRGCGYALFALAHKLARLAARAHGWSLGKPRPIPRQARKALRSTDADKAEACASARRVSA